MKTAFALALLAVNAQAGSPGGVVGTWKTNKQVDVNELQVCASHGTAVTSGASNTITYTYAGATCTAGTTAAELKWGSGATNVAGAEANLAAKSTCVIDDTKKTVVCNTIAVTQAHFSCARLMKCRPTTQTNAAGTFKVVQSETDTTPGVSAAATLFAPTALTKLEVVKPGTANAKVGAAEFDMEFKIDSTADIAAGKVVTVLAPGYTQAVGGTCKFGTGTASAATTAAGVDKWTFTVVGASGTAETTLKCTKVKVSATAKKAADKFAVFWGDSATASTEGEFVASPAIAAADPATGSASTVSLSAAALLLAASMYL
jgi:hypothetical protein